MVLTTFDSDELVLAALRDGAAGFLVKDTPPADLVAAVRRAAAGEPVLSPGVTATVIALATDGPGDARRRRGRTVLARLTQREREIALALGRGLTNAEIAEELHLALATVKTHVAAVFSKLGAVNRVQVARVVHDADLDEG